MAPSRVDTHWTSARKSYRQTSGASRPPDSSPDGHSPAEAEFVAEAAFVTEWQQPTCKKGVEHMSTRLTRSAVFTVSGMTCEDCARHVAAALEGAGATGVSVSWRDGKARFSWPEGVAEADLRAAVAAAGYQPRALRVATPAPGPAAERATGYDLVVLGAGSAAFAAAIKATEGGYRAALVEQGVIGGTCVNVGCVPSKALLRAAELSWMAGHHPFAGIKTTSGPVDLAAMVTQKDDLVRSLHKAKYSDLVSDYGFLVLHGRAKFSSPYAVDVDGRLVTAERFLVATGASPAAPPVPGLEEAGYLTSTTALDITEVPRRLAVIGANAVGLELGQFFLHLGSEVAFIDIAQRIAPFEEPEVSDALSQVLADQGAMIYTGAKVLGASKAKGHIDLELYAEGCRSVLVADKVLVATGRRPNTDGLGLEVAGVQVDERGAVVVDEQLRTTNERVFAAGDVTGGPQFVYVSAYEGALAADNALLGTGRAIDLTGLPRVIFTAPQVASAGKTEAEARSEGLKVEASVLPLEAVPRGLVNRDTRGLVKLVAEAGTGRLIGASLVAEGAGDVIQAAVLAIRHGLTTTELAATLHPYLTMAEALKLAAQTFTRDVEKLSCCAA
jgi:mercuric reductase